MVKNVCLDHAAFDADPLEIKVAFLRDTDQFHGHPVSSRLFHFDLFRLTDIDDLYAVGFFDYLRRGGVICVEWSENIPDLAVELESVWFADIKKTGENSREITIEKRDG